jgi:DNA replication protein DnaC
MVAAALIDGLIHHAHIITLQGKSYRLRQRDTGPTPAVQPPPLRGSA